ncbi:MAG TPA: PIN domain-containing protein [Streptosporangiaceae bacterium]
MRFADTNVLLYAISRDPAEQDKAKRANDILAGRDLALSVQVLQEFYVQATRASRPDAIGHRQAFFRIADGKIAERWAGWKPGRAPVR